MCGIIGGTLNPDQTKSGLDRMQRGNDGISIREWPEFGITLGFRRLAIIAPEDTSSMQPISKDDQHAAIVLNGEIFEYEKLRTQLKKDGFTFQSEGDVETVLNLYLQKKDHFCDQLDAMFAGAIFDWKKRPHLTIFRDWVGEEPLHYLLDPEKRQFVFASEIKGLLNVPGYKLEDVQTLEPGNVLEVNLQDFTTRHWQYFQLGENKSQTYPDLVRIGKEVRKLLARAADERIIADVPVCCLLSGGVDSIVTTYLIAKILQEQKIQPTLYTFHLKEQPIEPGTDLYHARIAADALGLRDRLVEVIVPAKEVIRALPEVIYALEDKRLKDFNVYPALYNYFIAQRITADGFKVVFNGEGSDELQGSYASWGSFTISPEEITKPEFRRQMVGNLYKGVLMRTSKVMMYAGPVEMRTVFLSRKVAEYMVNIPAKFLREDTVWKMPLVEAFKSEIPEALLRRPKARPQDSTGIMSLKEEIVRNYDRYGTTDREIFENIFKEKFSLTAVRESTSL